MIRDTWNVYHDFRCIAEKCPDSCCAGWQVDLDDEDVVSIFGWKDYHRITHHKVIGHMHHQLII